MDKQNSAQRTHISEDPYPINRDVNYIKRGSWPCNWITCPDAEEPPFVAAYRLQISADTDITARIHVTADERYQLFLDGKHIGRGSERGDPHNWYYESYDLVLCKGDHTLVARVWALGELAPQAQMSLRPGFLCAAEGDYIALLGTGHAPWKTKLLPGYRFDTDYSFAFGVGPCTIVDGSVFAWRFEEGEGPGWTDPIVLNAGLNGFVRTQTTEHLLKPATLPPMINQPVHGTIVRYVSAPDSHDTATMLVCDSHNLPDDMAAWTELLKGTPITIPRGQTRRVILDMDEYYCAYPEITTSGGMGSRIRVRWAESLFETPGEMELEKGNRDEIEGKYLRGVSDVFLPDGGTQRTFDTLWWRAGRYVELLVEAGDDPLTIERLSFRETRYPLEMEYAFQCDMPDIDQLIAMARRGLQMCAHETYLDCPYYEQLMYSGDTRLQVLTTYAITRDDRLPRKAITMFNASRLLDGLTKAQYPSRIVQIIPSFSLWWIGMVYDYALWRGDAAFVRGVMPGVRAVLDAYATFRNADGLVDGAQCEGHWRFVDWVPEWHSTRHTGMPPDAEFGVNGTVNWQYALILSLAARLEEFIAEPEMAARNQRLATEVAQRATGMFWDDKRGLLAEDSVRAHFSEHTQCMALLSGHLDPELEQTIVMHLFSDPDLSRTTISFSHYLFEVCRMFDRMDIVFDRLSLWFKCLERGMKTPLECENMPRSDCHGWGAHPIYHFLSSVLGIRPGNMGFQTVRIEPHMGSMKRAEGRLPHPQGDIEVDLRVEQGKLHGNVRLPGTLSGTFVYGNDMIPLRPGEQVIKGDR